MKIFFVLLVLFTIANTAISQQNLIQIENKSPGDTCIIFQPNAVNGIDAFLHQLTPNVNYGVYEDFISFDYTFSGTEALGYSVLKFNLTSIPVNAVISSAKLSLYHNPSSTGAAGQIGNNACNLKKITSTWNESTVTWNFAPTTTTSGQIYLPTSTSATQNYLDIEILPFVTNWISNPASNYGIMIEIIDKTIYNSMKFCSSDYPVDSMRPKLKICYKRIVSTENIENLNLDVTILPNPCHDFLNIQLTNIHENTTLNIYNNLGVVIESEQIISANENIFKSIDISKYPSGIYFIHVVNSKQNIIKKIIIE